MPKQTYVELRCNRGGKWYFVAIAGNGEIVATSEAYASRSNARRAATRQYPTAAITAASHDCAYCEDPCDCGAVDEASCAGCEYCTAGEDDEDFDDDGPDDQADEDDDL